MLRGLALGLGTGLLVLAFTNAIDAGDTVGTIIVVAIGVLVLGGMFWAQTRRPG